MSESSKSAPETLYLLFKLGLRSGDDDLGRGVTSAEDALADPQSLRLS